MIREKAIPRNLEVDFGGKEDIEFESVKGPDNFYEFPQVTEEEYKQARCFCVDNKFIAYDKPDRTHRQIWRQDLEDEHGWIKRSFDGNQNIYFRLSSDHITIQRPTYIELEDDTLYRVAKLFEHMGVPRGRKISWEVDKSGAVSFFVEDLYALLE